MKSRPVSLSVVYIVFMILISVLSALLLSFLVDYYSDRIIERNTASIREVYVESKKKEVREDVLKTIKSIDVYRKEEKARIISELRAILEKIYEIYWKLTRYSSVQNASDIESFLEYVFYNKNKYYVYFFKNYSSLYELLGRLGVVNSYQESKKKSLQFSNNIPIEIEGELKKWGKIEGFILCSKYINRCIFVFKPIDRIEEEIKKRILYHIVHFNMVSSKNKYIFINRLDGKVLILNNKIIDNGTKLWQIKKNTSDKVKNVFKKELQACRKGGGFITYTWYEPETGKISKKISYIGCYKPWKWIIGEGFYYDTIENLVSYMDKEVRYSTEVVIKIFYILISMVFIILIFAFLVFTKILDFKRIKIMGQLRESLNESKKLNVNIYKLKEIREFAENINRAIDIFKQYEEEFIIAFVNAIEMRDAYTQGHSHRVAYYSRIIAEALGFDEEKQEEVYRAGLLHDVGKIGIPDIILLKPDKLTRHEYEIIKYHAIFSYEIVSKVTRFKNIATYIKHHHERCDGSGYPDGLRCNEIEIEAKILAIADVFDALTSKRVYRKKLNPKEAIGIIEKDKLDQNIVAKVKDRLIEAFLFEENREEKPYLSKVEEIRKVLFEIDFKTGLKRRKIIINRAMELMLKREPFILALLKINNFDSLMSFSFKDIDNIISKISELLKHSFIKKNINTEFISYAFDDAFLILMEVKNSEELRKFKKILDKLPDEIKEILNEIKLDISIYYKVFPEEFDSDIDSLLMKLRTKK